MTLFADLFWSFRSPYSCLALVRACALAERCDLVLNARLVYPLAVRGTSFFARTDARFVRYVALDNRRVAEAEGIPFRFPRPTPSSRTCRPCASQPRSRASAA